MGIVMWDVVYFTYHWICLNVLKLDDSITVVTSQNIGIKPDLFHQYIIAGLVPTLFVCLSVIAWLAWSRHEWKKRADGK